MSSRKAKTNANLVSTDETIVPEQVTVKPETITPEVIEPEVTVINTTQVTLGNTVATPQKRLGRPIVPGSVRQIREAGRTERKANGTFRKGRPIVEGSARQIREAERAAKIASGIILKPGRPKVVKPAPEVVTTQTVTSENIA